MKKHKMGSKAKSKVHIESELYPDYPAYPPEEDIYDKFEEEEDLDPERIAEQPGSINEYILDEDIVDLDLDVPGAELDDQQEIIGSEDEENNYYSLGGENHEDLEEDPV